MALRAFEEDTIAAVSTPPGEGGIGIVRVSGRQAIAIADQIFESKKKLPVREQKSFTVQYGHVVAKRPDKTEIIDEALLTVMRAPKSYTTEDMVEISTHGGYAALQATLRLILDSGARPAQPGEFTKRAFLNGRIDLLQAEAVLDLIRAKTELGRRWGAAQMEGVLSKKITVFKEELIGILGVLEASIDFPEEGLEPGPLSDLGKRLAAAHAGMRALIAGSEWGEVVKRGFRVVLTGKPNVGKSSLMNRLTKTDRVIVTPYPGTTRDLVEEEIQIQGVPVRIWDTAGIQDTEHPIEKEGIERSKKATEGADLVLVILDASRRLDLEDEKLIRRMGSLPALLVLNKADLTQELDMDQLEKRVNGMPLVKTSCVTEAGIKTLEDKIFRFITHGKLQISEEVIVSSVRQRDLLQKASANIEGAIQACREAFSPEFIAADVRMALEHLGLLVGEAVTDDVLDALFSQFCIGK